MTLVEQLGRLQREVPGCRAIIYGDMATATVLRACADPDVRQEHHDAHLAEAALCLGPVASRLLGIAFGGDGECVLAARAVRVDQNEARFHLRSDEDPNEVLCVTVAVRTPLAGVGPALRRVGLPDD